MLLLFHTLSYSKPYIFIQTSVVFHAFFTCFCWLIDWIGSSNVCLLFSNNQSCERSPASITPFWFFNDDIICPMWWRKLWIYSSTREKICVNLGSLRILFGKVILCLEKRKLENNVDLNLGNCNLTLDSRPPYLSLTLPVIRLPGTCHA